METTICLWIEILTSLLILAYLPLNIIYTHNGTYKICQNITIKPTQTSVLKLFYCKWKWYFPHISQNCICIQMPIHCTSIFKHGFYYFDVVSTKFGGFYGFFFIKYTVFFLKKTVQTIHSYFPVTFDINGYIIWPKNSNINYFYIYSKYFM